MNDIVGALKSELDLTTKVQLKVGWLAAWRRGFLVLAGIALIQWFLSFGMRPVDLDGGDKENGTDGADTAA